MLTREVLKELLHYDPDTGIFTWKYRDRKWFKNLNSFRGWNTKYALKQSGYTRKSSNKDYIIISVLGVDHKAHRLAFLYENGELPSEEVDHIDGNGANNAWSNLRKVSRATNCKNQRLHTTNNTGVSGVNYRKDRARWQVRISINNKMTNFGNYKDKFEAICIRKSAELTYDYHQNHGQVRPL